MLEHTAVDFGELKDGTVYPSKVLACQGLQHSLIDVDMGSVKPGLRSVSCGECEYSYVYNAKAFVRGLRDR